MTIAEIIRDGYGKSHGWRVGQAPPFADEDQLTGLWHYGTLMLVWSILPDMRVRMVHYDLGHGSVSDQNGMNIAFRELGLPYRYRRDRANGGARVEHV